MRSLHDTNPDVVPRPHAWGKLDENNMAKTQDSRLKTQERENQQRERMAAGRNSYMGEQQAADTYFILYDFVHSSGDDLPDPAILCAHLARIHRTTLPTKEFGFDTLRSLDGVVLEPAWDRSWADCFSRLVTTFFNHEISVNGRWPDYEAAFKNLINRTVPRMLGRLRSKGQHITPSLVHGNLSSDNVAVRQADGMPVLFSACAMYAHNEYELGAASLAGNGFDSAFVDQYLRTALPSEPVDEVHDRIILYGIRFRLGFSISHSTVIRERYVKASSVPRAECLSLHWVVADLRDSIYGDMRYLNSKYADR